ncbi:hypothetical protein L1049_002960 [Liquidambar formosana]|uniref:Uncharacterized protein n=1 Tax=Liquidambar formosana TaxID=63359 RepID=A0AAP0NI61_LIQFO
MSGFALSPLTNMWDVEPEVWKTLIEARPKVKKWMNTPIPHYDKLSRMFGKDRATSLGATTAKEKVRQWVAKSENDKDDSKGGS